jgi:hypothetical protein
LTLPISNLPHITAFLLLMTLLWLPLSQDENPRALAPPGICTWLLPGGNLNSSAATSSVHLSDLLTHSSSPSRPIPVFCADPHLYILRCPLASPQISGNLVNAGHVQLVLDDTEVPVIAAGR